MATRLPLVRVGGRIRQLPAGDTLQGSGGGVSKASANIGDGAATAITFTHNLNTKDVTVSVRDASTDEWVLCDWKASSVNAVQLSFAVAPTAGQYRVTVTG